MPSTLEQSITRETMLVPLSEKSIQQHLNELSLNTIGNIHIFSSIDSTNNYLLEGEMYTDRVSVCLAEQQTNGRGRYGHQWVSPSGVNLYLSMLWPVKDTHQQFEVLSLWLLLAMVELLEDFHVKNIQLKWPNDICIKNKKLGGVLIEQKVGQNKQNLVIGIGLNVAMSKKDNVLLDTPWIDLLLAKPDWQVSRNELAAKVINAFCLVLTNFEQNRLTNLARLWGSYDMLVDKEIKFNLAGEIENGKVLGIDDLGKIVLEINDKIEHLHSSQISNIEILDLTK